MNFQEIVKQRQSCRRYSSKPVPSDSIERCLEAARLAPSACNSQPWQFIVVQDEALKDQLAQKAFSGIYALNSFAATAPVLVVLVRQQSKYISQLAAALRDVQYSLIDIGIAGEHFVLQAAEEGLSTCWLGWFNDKAVKKILNLPRKAKVDIIISLGYAESPKMRDKKRMPLSEISELR